MSVLAHLGGVPVEELALSLSSIGGALVVARIWLRGFLAQQPPRGARRRP